MNSKRQNKNWDCGPTNKRPRRTEDINSTYADEPIVSKRPPNFTRLSPSEVNDRSMAKIILRRHATAPITEDQALSRNDFLRTQKDIEWANAVLPHYLENFRKSNPQAAEPVLERLIVKLQRPPQEVQLNSPDVIDDVASNISSYQPSVASAMMKVQSPEPKRAKRTFAEIARGRKLIGLIDNGSFEGKIPRNQWDWVQASLASVALEVLRENPGPPPSCTDAGWFQGNTKLIACDNDRSALLYKWAIDKVGEVYPGAQLEVVDIKDIPSRPWATAWLPEIPSESADILDMLSSMNPDLPMEGFKVIRADRFERAMMLVIFQINHLSIDYLTKCDGLLNYGSNKIRMQFYTTPQDALSNLEAFAAAVDSPTEEDELDTNDSHFTEDLSFLSDYGDDLN